LYQGTASACAATSGAEEPILGAERTRAPDADNCRGRDGNPQGL